MPSIILSFFPFLSFWLLSKLFKFLGCWCVGLIIIFTLVKCLTSSLHQPVKFLGWKVSTHTHTPANSRFSNPVINILLILCVWCKTGSLTNSENKKAEGFHVSHFLLVIFECNHSIERVKFYTFIMWQVVNFGQRNDGRPVENVALPPWADGKIWPPFQSLHFFLTF